jgi:DNA-binding transcriptional MerR regulator/methylmalonyl-CoA mutase cobalamin-binding subunit
MATADESTVPRHPIGVVAERTRLSQDVLRVWERRYGVVEPGRSSSGQRLYSDADIERLRLLSLATQTGRSIGLIAGLSTRDLAQMVREDEEARTVSAADADRGVEPANDVIAPALERIVALDGPGLDALLRRSILAIGMPAFLDGVASPLLTRIGDEWHAGRLTPAQEHLGAAVIQRVITSVMQTVAAAPGAPNLIVATPAGERHEIGAVLAAAATAEGWRVTYLGADLPAGDIAEAASRTNAQAVGLSVIYVADRGRVIEEIHLLRARLPAAIPLLIGGAASASLAGELSRDGVRVLGGLDELRAALRGVPLSLV